MSSYKHLLCYTLGGCSAMISHLRNVRSEIQISIYGSQYQWHDLRVTIKCMCMHLIECLISVYRSLHGFYVQIPQATAEACSSLWFLAQCHCNCHNYIHFPLLLETGLPQLHLQDMHGLKNLSMAIQTAFRVSLVFGYLFSLL